MITNISEEIPFDIPKNWCFVRLSTICDYVHRGKSPKYGNKKDLPIIAQKCNQWSGLEIDKCLFAESSSIDRYFEEQFLKVNDIIINSTGTGTVGRTGIIKQYIFDRFPKYVADSHITVVRANSNTNSDYLYLYLISPFIQTNIESKCSGSTNQIELATNTINNYIVALPPLNEQNHIVNKVNMIYNIIKGEN